VQWSISSLPPKGVLFVFFPHGCIFLTPMNSVHDQFWSSDDFPLLSLSLPSYRTYPFLRKVYPGLLFRVLTLMDYCRSPGPTSTVRLTSPLFSREDLLRLFWSPPLYEDLEWVQILLIVHLSFEPCRVPGTVRISLLPEDSVSLAPRRFRPSFVSSEPGLPSLVSLICEYPRFQLAFRSRGGRFFQTYRYGFFAGIA